MNDFARYNNGKDLANAISDRVTLDKIHPCRGIRGSGKEPFPEDNMVFFQDLAEHDYLALRAYLEGLYASHSSYMVRQFTQKKEMPSRRIQLETIIMIAKGLNYQDFLKQHALASQSRAALPKHQQSKALQGKRTYLESFTNAAEKNGGGKQAEAQGAQAKLSKTTGIDKDTGLNKESLVWRFRKAIRKAKLDLHSQAAKNLAKKLRDDAAGKKKGGAPDNGGNGNGGNGNGGGGHGGGGGGYNGGNGGGGANGGAGGAGNSGGNGNNNGGGGHGSGNGHGNGNGNSGNGGNGNNNGNGRGAGAGRGNNSRGGGARGTDRGGRGRGADRGRGGGGNRSRSLPHDDKGLNQPQN